MTTVNVYTATEISLESHNVRDNPYLDVDITAVFTGPAGQSITRPGFWDGGQRWCLRFAPTAPGRWTYRVDSGDPTDPGLHGITGDLDAVIARRGTAVTEHGFLCVADNGHHLQHQDGTPFFWLGDTHWRFAWERWDEANKPGWTSQFRGTIDRRVDQGFTVYQSNLMGFGRGWDAATCWEPGAAFNQLVPSYFRDVIDPRMAYIADRGLVNAFGIGWHQAIDLDPAGMARFARYLVARYGAAAMVWTLGGEVAGYDPGLRAARIDGWRQVAHAIHDADDYQHPRTAHLTNERPIADYYQDEDWLDLTLHQHGHGDLELSTRAYHDHRTAHPGRPLVEGESLYEGITTVEPVGRRTATATMVRQVAYRAIQSGCCGYTYGAQGCWNNAWDDGDLATAWGDLPWHQGVDLEGATHLGHLRRFYESLDWTVLRPAPHLFTTTSGIDATFYRPEVSADPQRRTAVVYFGETYRNEGSAALTGLDATAVYHQRWCDPRSGTWLPGPQAVTPANGLIAIPDTPENNSDWLLVLTAYRSLGNRRRS